MNDLRSSWTMASRPRTLFAAALAIFAITLSGACSGDGGDAAEGDSCETSSECSGDLQCVDGVCSSLQGNNQPDGGVDGGDGGGNNTVIEPEDYFVSYLFRDKDAETTSLRVYSTADDSHTQINPESISCDTRCWLSGDMKYFLWAERNADNSSNRDIFRASVVDLKVQDDTEPLVENVSSASVVGNLLTYRRDNNGQYVAYYMPIDTAEERSLGSLGSSQSTLNGWMIDPDNEMGVIFSPEPQVLRLKVGQLGQNITDTSYTFSAENYQEISGGYFGSSMPLAISRDGKRLAFVTQAPNDYGACDTADDCSGPVKRCGRFGMCTAIEVTAHFIDLENLGALGQSCGGPGTCEGDIHECYAPNAPNFDDAVCRPGRVVVGMPRQPVQRATPQSPDKNGCELTSGHEGYHYTELRAPLSFDAAGNLYTVGVRDCPTGDNPVGDSDVLKIDPVSKTHEVVWGNPNDEGGYDGDLCWDADAQEPDDEQCVPFIRSALLSPAGKELAMTATNPWVGDPARATENMGLWTVLRNGEEQSWAGEQGVREVVEKLVVHPAP